MESEPDVKMVACVTFFQSIRCHIKLAKQYNHIVKILLVILPINLF